MKDDIKKSLRDSQLKTILANANRALLIFEDSESSNVNLFENFLREINSGTKIESLHFKEDAQLNSKDVIFPLFTSFKNYVWTFNNAVLKGVAHEQIIPPTVFYFPLLAEKNGFIKKPNLESFQLPILATIDIVNMCNLDCATCAKPAWQENNERMSFDLFTKILDKLQLIGIRFVELYNYTEPFLHPEIYKFMAEVKRRGLALGISTNLSRPNIPNLKECVDLLRDGDWFVITISGMQQKLYEINHRRGKIENVLDNLKEIAKSANRHCVHLRLLKFDYNVGELQAAVDTANKFGIGFEYYLAEGSPFEPCSARKERKDLIDKRIGFEEYSDSFSAERRYCFFIHSRNIVINHKGNVELCCQYVQRPYDLGSFLEQDISVIQLKRDMHPVCRSCKYFFTDESKTLIKDFPVDSVKANNVLIHGMKTACLERMFSPEGSLERRTQDFLNDAVIHFLQK